MTKNKQYARAVKPELGNSTAGETASASPFQQRTNINTAQDEWFASLIDNNPFEVELKTLQDKIAKGRYEAKRGEHAAAIKTFGEVYQSVQTHLYELSNRDDRIKMDSTMSVLDGASYYSKMGSLYGLVREILSVYPVLRTDAELRGNSQESLEMQRMNVVLRFNLEEYYTNTSHASNPFSTLELEAENRLVGNRIVEGYRIHAVEGSNMFVMPFGESEGGGRGIDSHTMLDVLAGQSRLMDSIVENGAVAAEFGDENIDITDDKTRNRLWRTMYLSDKDSGDKNSLGNLMDVVSEYLEHYTVHLGFNMNDFDAHHLEADMPQDLMGRLVMDCGAFAMRTAWEVFNAVEGTGSKVTFKVFTTLNHVFLVIEDVDQGLSYVANNNKILGPVPTGNQHKLKSLLAGIGGQENGLNYTFTPMLFDTIGSSSDSSDVFSKKLIKSTTLMSALSINDMKKYKDDVKSFDNSMNWLNRALSENSELTVDMEKIPKLMEISLWSIGKLFSFDQNIAFKNNNGQPDLSGSILSFNPLLLDRNQQKSVSANPPNVGMALYRTGKGTHPLVRWAEYLKKNKSTLNMTEQIDLFLSTYEEVKHHLK